MPTENTADQKVNRQPVMCPGPTIAMIDKIRAELGEQRNIEVSRPQVIAEATKFFFENRTKVK